MAAISFWRRETSFTAAFLATSLRSRLSALALCFSSRDLIWQSASAAAFLLDAATATNPGHFEQGDRTASGANAVARDGLTDGGGIDGLKSCGFVEGLAKLLRISIFNPKGDSRSKKFRPDLVIDCRSSAILRSISWYILFKAIFLDNNLKKGVTV